MTTTRWSLNTTTGGLWATAGNWTAGVPTATGDAAIFDITDAALSGGGAGTRTIDLGGVTRSLTYLYMTGDGTRSWNISNGTLVLQPFGGPAVVNYGSASGASQGSIAAALQFAGDVQFNVSSATALSVAAISESGGARALEKLGNGLLILTQTAGYSGATTITAGTLQIGMNGGTTGMFGSGDVANNGAIVFNRSGTYTVANLISGSGSLAIGDGSHATTVTFSAANSFTGSVVIRANAILQVNHADALGASGALTAEAGGRIEINASLVTGADTGALFNRLTGFTGTLSNTTALTTYMTADVSGSRLFEGNLTGDLYVTKTGTGTLYLTGSSHDGGYGDNAGLDITQGTVALAGAASLYYNVFLRSGGTFDLTGADGQVTIRDLGLEPGGRVLLGGHTLIIDQAYRVGLSVFSPTLVATSGLSDGLEIRLDPNAFGLFALPSYALQNWENGVDTITIIGNAGFNAITGTRYNDTLRGGRDGLASGNDTLDGGLGDDKIYGGDGDDTLTGGLGDDLLDGGDGTDTVSYASAPASSNGVGVTVSLTITAQGTGSMGYDTLIDIENLTGSRNNDTLRGNSGANVINGLNGNDTIEGGAGADTLDGGSGIDTLSYAHSSAGVRVNLATRVVSLGDADGDIISHFENATGSAFADNLAGTAASNVLGGGDGNDVLNGAGGDDNLSGGMGVDTLRGGTGADMISGGGGNDIFFYAAPEEGGDTIIDFHNRVGDDDRFRFLGSAFHGLPAGTLDLSHFVANTSGAATNASQWFVYETDTGILSYDADGNGAGAAVVIARLAGLPTLTAVDVLIV